MFYIYKCKNSSPAHCDPTRTPKAMSESCHVNFSCFGPVVHEKTFKISFLYKQYKNSSPIVTPPDPQGPWF
jgi:hypothetical protein